MGEKASNQCTCIQLRKSEESQGAQVHRQYNQLSAMELAEYQRQTIFRHIALHAPVALGGELHFPGQYYPRLERHSFG